jgi:hypothetical protein
MPGSVVGICRTCGEPGTGLPFEEWVRPTFTDWSRLTIGEITCHACQFCFTDQNEPLTVMTGKDKTQRMRNYSHFVARGIWTPLSKGDKKGMRAQLTMQPEVAVIALSGQKHIIFRSKPGWWQIEEDTYRPFPDALNAALPIVEALYNGGFAKTEIQTGRYIQRRILDFGLSGWDALERRVWAMRGSPVLDLALFLAQKEEADDERRDSGETPVASISLRGAEQVV